MSEPSRGEKTGLLGIGAVAVAVLCCAGGPLLLVATAGSLAAGAWLGIGAGLVSLGAAVLAARRAGALGALGVAGAGWFGASHLVAVRTGYAGCPELGAIPSVILRREVQVGCVPWRIADRRLGLAQ
jgi:hypothetical protein